MAVAREIASEAGDTLVERFHQVKKVTTKGRGNIVTDVDTEVEEKMLETIRREFPDMGFLGEESKGVSPDSGYVWIVDPVDGTREYGEGRPDWAVHVGLAVDGVAHLGAVALPGMAGQRVLRSDQPIACDPTTCRPRMVVSRTRPAAEAVAVSDTIRAELIGMGSAGAKSMAVVRGEAEIYLHTGGQYEWDSAAPAAVALAHGLHASRIDGSPLVYNNADTYMPDLLICRTEWAEQVLAEVAKIST